MKQIDYRSDTITQPTDKMRHAMANAIVGDDVYEEDPTVKALEEKAADMMDKEAGLFVPSGTMGNQLAVKTHTRPGDEIILEKDSHIYYYEVGGMGAISGVQGRTLTSNLGAIDPEIVRDAIRGEDIHFPSTSLICLENTHNKSGGTVIPLENMEAIYEIAKENQIPLHLDGARIFNASTYLKTDVRNIAKYTDTIMFCLSKGLCAPIGSILVGSKEFITKARKNRKMLGGGMRQAGIIAAAGIIALEDMVDRLEEDHATARALGEGFNNITGLSVNPETLQTNIVMCDITKENFTAIDLVTSLKKEGILSTVISSKRIRFVTNYHIGKDDIEQTIQIVNRMING